MKFAVFATTLFAAAAVPAVSNAQQKCGSNDVLLWYGNNPNPVGYSFGECYPFKVDGLPTTKGMVTRLAKCNYYKDVNCMIPANPFQVPIPILPCTSIPNPLDFEEILAENGKCERL